MADTHRFRAELEAARAGGAFVLLPPDIATALGGTKQMRVIGSINSIPYQSSTMPYGGRGLFMGVHKATQAAAGIALGDLLDVEISRDDRPRVLELPPELESAFTADPALRERFESLAFTRRKELAVPIGAAKLPAARASRLEKALRYLRELG